MKKQSKKLETAMTDEKITSTAIYKQAQKVFPKGTDLLYWFTIVFGYGENEFYRIDNEDNEYDIFRELQDKNLIQTKTIPHWKDGSYFGTTTEFLYNKNMEYRKIATMQYLVTGNNEPPFFTEWFDSEMNYCKGMIVFDMLNRFHTTDGINWIETKEDHL